MTAAPLAAQTVVSGTASASSTKGFFLGAQLNGSAISADDLSISGTGLTFGGGA